MPDFVAEIAALDFSALDSALSRARTAIEQGQQLSLGDLNPIALLGDLGGAITAVGDVRLDPAQREDLGQQALTALGTLIELPDLSGSEQIVGGLGQLAEQLSPLVTVFNGDGPVLDRVFTALSGSMNVDALLDEITDRAAQALEVVIPEELTAPLRSLAALAGDPQPDELLGILGTVFTGLDIAAIGQLVTSSAEAVRLVATAGDAGPLEATIATVRVRLELAYTLLATPTVDVAAVLAAIDDVGGALDVVDAVLPAFADGLATDLRTATNALADLDLTTRLDGLITSLPLPGEDIPQLLVDSLEGMADSLEELTGPTVTAAMAAMTEELLEVSGLDQLSELLAGMDVVFNETGGLLDRLPMRKLRDDAVAALAAAEQATLTFDGFRFLDAAVAPIRELETTIRTLDPSTVTDAVQSVVDQLNALLGDVDVTPVRDAVDAVIDPLGTIVDQLVPFVQEVADQLGQLVDQLDDIDFAAAGSATLDLLHSLREQVVDAVGGGDVPEPVRAVIAGAAAVLRELDVAAELSAPFDSAVISIDVGALIEPINDIWEVAAEALGKATPAALISELDPPFDQLVATLDQLTLDPLIDAVQRLFDDLLVELGQLDPRQLVAPLESQFQDLVGALTAALDPGPLFAPLRAAYQSLQELLDRIDVTAMLHGVLGGLADMPHQLTTRLGERLQTDAAGALPAPTADGFQLGDILRPLALFLAEVRGRLAELGDGVLGPVLTELATATRGLRTLVDPMVGDAARLAEALDARLTWLDPNAGDGPLARLRTDIESFRLAVPAADVSVEARAQLSASAAGIQFDTRVTVTADATADVQHHADRVRSASDPPGLGRSLRLLARALDDTLPATLLTGALDPTANTDDFLDAVFARLDPTPLADQLDAVGVRVEARFLALAEEIANGMFQLIDGLFSSIDPLMPQNVIPRLQAGIDQVLDRFTALDPAPIEDEVRDVIHAAISLLSVHSPAVLAAELGHVFDSCMDQLRALSPATLFEGLDPFASIRTQLEDLRPSTILSPLVSRTAGFSTALDTIASIDLTFAVDVVDEIKQGFSTALDGVEAEWNTLLDELAQLSGSASAGVG